MTVREEKEIFITEIIEIYYSMIEECEAIAEFFGCERTSSSYGGIANFNKQIARLQTVVLGLSGVISKANYYHDKLVEIGAASCYIGRFEAVNCAIYEHAMEPRELAEWLLDYGDGKLFGEPSIAELDTPPAEPGPAPFEWRTNAEEVRRCGLLKPRPPGKNTPHLHHPMEGD